MDFDFTTKTGWQKFFGFVLTLVVEVLTIMGVSQSSLDMTTSIAAILMPVLAMVGLFIVNQMAAKGKAVTAQAALVTKTEMVKSLAEIAPEVAIAIATNVEPIVIKIPQVKDKIKAARIMFGTWEGAKSFLLNTFGDRFEAAIKRFASISNSKIEVVRRAVLEVVNVQLDTKTCELIGNTPGFLGAVSAGMDITIMGEFFTVIDKTPELDYLKTAFTNRAVWYAVKQNVDEAAIRVRAGQGDALSRLALQEFGVSAENARKSEYSGGIVEVYTPAPPGVMGFQFIRFNPFALAGVDSSSMQDLR